MVLLYFKKHILILFNYYSYFRYNYLYFNLYLNVSAVGSCVKWCYVTIVCIWKAGSDTTRTKLISNTVHVDPNYYELHF